MATLTTKTNGLEYEASDVINSGKSTPKKTFMPSSNNLFERIELYDNKVICNQVSGVFFEISVDGSNNTLPVNNINGVTINNITELYNEFVALL